MPQSTIAAISTPLGSGGIGIVRLSGPQAFAIGEKVFAARSGKPLFGLRGYEAILGHVFDAQGNYDDAIATLFRAPKSYTGEDVLEISCHGGSWVLRKLLACALAQGAAMAEPGEFTRRAFLNGKLDLTQAEGIMAIISARGDAALKAAMQAREGVLSAALQKMGELILEQAAHLAAWTDYPEEDVASVQDGALCQALAAVQQQVAALVGTFGQGQAIHEGVPAVIVGKPNVGKSTLMNALAGAQRSIVTAIPGTTRDVVSDMVQVGDVMLRLSDTAGIHTAQDEIEKIGIERAKQQLESAQLVLAVFDGSRPLDKQDEELLEALQGRAFLAVVNKSDLPRQLDTAPLRAATGCVVCASAKTGEGMADLRRQVAEMVNLHQLDASAPLVFTLRQQAKLQECQAALIQAVEALEAGMTLDAVGVCVDTALEALFSLTGQRASDAVIDQVFANFCVGK
jgi:tRNA modification GTPase TrmE